MKALLFDPIQINEMEQVKLMNRTDRKYCLHVSRLEHILDSIKNDFYILTIDNENSLAYTSTYFDTPTNSMYIAHQNGKLNRFKIRKRTYISSNISFLEVKFKSNKGRTIKKRIPSQVGTSELTPKESEFISKYTPFANIDLKPVLVNEFNRLTLVNKNFKERCTIDLGLKFNSSDTNSSLNNLAIIEIKADGNSEMSALAKALRDDRIKESGMSKYCIGRLITDEHLKQNRFKEKIRNISKITNFNIN